MQVLKKDNKRSFKKIILVLSFIFLLLIPPIIASAENYNVITEEDLDGAQRPGIVEKQLSKLFINLANSLIGISGAQDVTVLVFQRPDVVDDEQSWISNTTSAERDQLVFGIYPEGVFNGIAAFYDAFAYYFPLPVLLIFVGIGIILLFDVIRSVDNRSKIKDVLLGLIFAVLLMRFGHILWDWIIYVNFLMVDTVYFLLKENNIHVTSFISTIWNPANTDEVMTSPSIMIAILVLAAALMTFAINYQYMLRIILTGVLIVLFPIVVFSVLIPSRRNVLGQWFGLFTMQIFMQAAHAICLGLFFYFLANAEDVGFWLVMVIFFGLPMVTDLVQRTISGFLGNGFGGGVGTSMANASGLSSLVGVAAMSKGLFKGKGGSGNDSAKSSGGKAKGNAGEAMGGAFGSLNNKANPISNGASDSTRNGLVSANEKAGSDDKPSNLEFGSSLNSIGSASTGVSQNDRGHSGFVNKAHESSGASYASSLSDFENTNDNNSSSGLNDSSLNVKSMNSKGDNALALGSAQLGKSMRRIGKAAAHSNGLKMSARVASTAALATAGYALGTMATGKGSSGATMGAVAGYALGGKPAEFAIEKGGKMTEFGGELIQSKAEGNEAMALTKERLGYHDSAQLSDPQEMARMGQELIGGNTGQVLGKAVGSVNHAGGKYNITPPQPIEQNFNAREAYEAVNTRQNLQHVVLPQSEQQAVEAKRNLDNIGSQLEIAKAQVKAYPNNPEYKKVLQATQQQHAKAKIQYETKKRNHETLKEQASKFYENRKMMKQSENLRQTRKSSGRL